MSKPTWLLALVGLAVVAGLPFLGHWLRGTREGRCALDGVGIGQLYQVRIVDQAGQSHAFCCIRCAELWLKGREAVAEPVRAVYVTDEASGQEVEAASAYFVRSLVVTVPTTANRIHAFRKLEDAEKHAREGGGAVLAERERPFASGSSRAHSAAE